jgi:transcriptional regulator with XRE-family HTH domain
MPCSVSHAPSPVIRNAWRELFGSMIQERREAIGLSVEDAARLAGMEFSEWAAVESGEVAPDQDRLRAISDALEIGFDQMALTVYLCQGAWAE